MHLYKHRSFDYSGYNKSDIYNVLSDCQDELLQEKEEHLLTMEELLKERKLNQNLQNEIQKLKNNNAIFKL